MNTCSLKWVIPLIVILLLCCGCTMEMGDSLFALPNLPTEYVQLQEHLETILKSGAEYTYAEEGTPCHENYDPSTCLRWAQCPEEYSKACDGEGVCVQCPTNDNVSGTAKWTAIASKLATGEETPVKGCSCANTSLVWDGSYCSYNMSGGGD